MRNLSQSNDLLDPLYRAAFYLGPRPEQLGNDGGQMGRRSQARLCTTDAKSNQDKPR